MPTTQSAYIVAVGKLSMSNGDDGALMLVYVPLPVALCSSLDCPGFEADTAPAVVTEEL